MRLLPARLVAHLLLTGFLLAGLSAHAETAPPGAVDELEPALAAEIDASVREVLAQSQAPSASVAIVRDGRIAYVKAYGHARLDPEPLAATPVTRYGIGSVSKQFCAAAVLRLVEDGKLRLDDPVDHYLSGVPANNTVTVRQLLNHTAGLRDYWPQDYVFAAMLRPTTPDAVLDGWGRKPLDFAPGTDWQYSNTGYVAAGRIVEKVSGQGLMDFLRERLFVPLGMNRVSECDTRPLSAPDAAAYTRTALGPVRPAPKEGAGWLFATGELAMNPHDLAAWDIALLMDQRVLGRDALREMTTPVVLKNGKDLEYGLGVGVSKDAAGRTVIGHGGSISGFTSQSRVWPEQRVVVVVFVNADWTNAAGTIVSRLSALVLPPTGPDAEARAFFHALQRGHPDAAKMSDNLRAFFTAEALRDAVAGLGPLGPARTLRKLEEEERGGMTMRAYEVTCAHGQAAIALRVWSDGRYEQFNVNPSEH